MSDKYTKSARGQHCTVRLPGICTGNTETTVFAHLNGAGMGRKHSSIHGAYCCYECHMALDGHHKCDIPKDDLHRWHLEGVIRTQQIMLETGVLKL